MRRRAFAAGQNVSLPALEVTPPAFATGWLLSFSIPWDDMIVLPQQVQLARVLAVVVGVVWVCSVVRGGAVRRPDAAHWWMGAFAVWASASIFWSNDPEVTVRRSLSYLQLFLITWVIYQFSANRACHVKLLQAFVWGEYVLAAGLLVAYFTGQASGDGRYSAPGVNANDAASTLALGVPIACYLVAILPWRRSWCSALYVPVSTMCILLSASRGGLLTLGAAALFPLLLLSKLRWKTRAAIAVVLALSAFAAFNFTESFAWQRLSTMGEQFTARDLNGRFDVWATAMSLFQSNPWLGIGAGTFARTTGSRQVLAISGHNSFIELLAENGGIGLTLFLIIILCVTWRRYRAARIEGALWKIVLAAWVITNLSCSWENKDLTWLLWSFMLGYPALQRSPAVFAFERTLAGRTVTCGLRPVER